MIDKKVHEELDRIIQEELAEYRKKHHRKCPACDGPCIEIFSTIAPVGYSGVFKCLVCNRAFDPTFADQEL